MNAMKIYNVLNKLNEAKELDSMRAITVDGKTMDIENADTVTRVRYYDERAANAAKPLYNNGVDMQYTGTDVYFCRVCGHAWEIDNDYKGEHRRGMACECGGQK